MASALKTLMPDMETRIIPDEAVPHRPWQEASPAVSGVGARVIEGGWASLRSRDQSRVIWAIAPDSPAKRAGLQIGDRILAVDGIQPAWTNDALKGPHDTQVILTVQRGKDQPFNVPLIRKPIHATFHECMAYGLTQDR